MSGRGDDAFWRTEEERRADEESWMEARGFSVPSFTGGTRREEIVGDFFKPEMDEKQTTLAKKWLDSFKDEIKPRGSVLKEAMDVINGERQDVYGSPEDSFALIGLYWGIYLQSKGLDDVHNPLGEGESLVILPDDVAMMMTLFKIAREANQHKRDNIVDAAGYLGIYADMQEDK